MNSVLHAPIPFAVAAALGFLVLMPAAGAARQAPPPVAVLDAPATVAYGHDITVSGARSSSPSAIIIKFIWTLDGGTPIETALPTHTFAADPAHPFVVGPHTVRLVVVDSAGFLSAPDSATVTVIDNVAPTAVLDAPATVAFGADLTVSGARSTDVGGTIVRYAWTLDGGITFETADAAFTFVFDPAHPLGIGNHTVRLVVVDSSGNVSAPDAATVRVIDNLAPAAVLDAPAAVGFGLDITASGARSADIGGSIVWYRWTLDGGPVFETVDPTFTFAADPAHPFDLGSHTVRLVVVDDAGNVSAPDTATVRVIDNVAPTAVLDAPATVAFGLGFTVSGAQSADIGGSIVRYLWTLDGGPAFQTSDSGLHLRRRPVEPAGPRQPLRPARRRRRRRQCVRARPGDRARRGQRGADGNPRRARDRAVRPGHHGVRGALSGYRGEHCPVSVDARRRRPDRNGRTCLHLRGRPGEPVPRGSAHRRACRRRRRG